MAKYAVRIEEILAKTIIVEATNYDEACDKVGEAYHEGRIELDYGCFYDVGFGYSHWGSNAISENNDVSYYEHLDG